MSPRGLFEIQVLFDPTPQKEEVPLALQLANKTKARGSVLAQIERERVLVGDLKAKYEKHTDALTQLMERKVFASKREIEELELLSVCCCRSKAAKCPGGTFGPRSTTNSSTRWSSGNLAWAPAIDGGRPS